MNIYILEWLNLLLRWTPVVTAIAWTCAAVAGALGFLAAFLTVGAMMATAMGANVFFWTIPGQKKVIAQMLAGSLIRPGEPEGCDAAHA